MTPSPELIPYARSEILNGRYGLVCPECGEFCQGVDEGQPTAEDAVTKGANKVYALHYQEAHMEVA